MASRTNYPVGRYAWNDEVPAKLVRNWFPSDVSDSYYYTKIANCPWITGATHYWWNSSEHVNWYPQGLHAPEAIIINKCILYFYNLRLTLMVSYMTWVIEIHLHRLFVAITDVQCFGTSLGLLQMCTLPNAFHSCMKCRPLTIPFHQRQFLACFSTCFYFHDALVVSASTSVLEVFFNLSFLYIL